jgi:hypothetical protein
MRKRTGLLLCEDQRRGEEIAMARIIVMPDLENGHPAPIVFDEQVSAIHVDNKHSAFQLIERLAWAIHDAEEIEHA